MTIQEIWAANPRAVAVRTNRHGGITRATPSQWGAAIIETQYRPGYTWDPTNVMVEDFAADDWSVADEPERRAA